MDRCFHQSVRVLGIPPGGVLGTAVPIIADIFDDVYPQIQRNTQKVKLYITMWPTTSNYMEKQDCIPVGCVPPTRWPYLPACSAGGHAFLGGWCGGCLLLGGVCSGGCLLQGGVYSGGSAPGGCLLLGGCLLPEGDVYPSMHWGRHPPCEENHTHLWKHNLPPTSLQAVTRMHSSRLSTARLLTVSHIIPCILGGHPSRCRPPWRQIPLDTDPPWMQTPRSCDLVMHAGKPSPPWTEWDTGVKTLPCGW